MGPADKTPDHRARCQPYLLRLRLLARSEAGISQPLQIVAEVTEATGAVLAEAEAADQAARAAAEVNRRSLAAGMFLRVRLNRLARAAAEAVAAARDGDTARLRHYVRRFEAVTSAIWAAEHAVCGPADRWNSSGVHGR